MSMKNPLTLAGIETANLIQVPVVKLMILRVVKVFRLRQDYLQSRFRCREVSLYIAES